MNLHHLRAFARVVELRSFSRAADALHVSQPAVSKAIRELESQLGLPLLERSSGRGNAVRPTLDGASLYEHARGLFAIERAAIDDIRQRAGVRKGRLRLGASTTVAGYWLPAYVATFVQRFPAIDFALHVSNTADMADAIREGRIDAAFVEGTVEGPAIQISHWRDEPLQIVAAADAAFARRRKLSPDDLAGHPWLLREAGSGTRQAADRLLRALGMETPRHAVLGSNEAIARAVAAGAGIAVLPAVVVREPVEAGRMRILRLAALPSPMRPLYQLELRDRPRSPALQAFVEIAGSRA